MIIYDILIYNNSYGNKSWGGNTKLDASSF